MRIYCAVRHSADPRRFYGGLWSTNFYPALRALGHEIAESGVDLLPASRFMDVGQGFTKEEKSVRSDITERIVDEVKNIHAEGPVDLFLSYFYNAHFDPSGYDEIRRLGIPSVNFFCNAIHQFPLVAAVAPAADFAWHAERDARPQYVAVGAKPVWVQMAADPETYHPVDCSMRAAKACFAGMRYADRDAFVEALVRARIPLALYGPGWGSGAMSVPSAASMGSVDSEGYLGRLRQRPGSLASYVTLVQENFREDGLWGGSLTTVRQMVQKVSARGRARRIAPFALGPVRPDQIRDVFSSHEVILNFSNVWAHNRPGTRLIPHVRLRDFEAPMCRSCYLTGHTDEIGEFYEIGKEIDTYCTPEELVDKTRFYLSHPDAAERMREAGYRRALRDHQWTNRFAELFRKIGLRARG